MKPEKQLTRWHEAGIINAEQVELLKHDLKQQAETSYRKNMLATIFTIGGLLVATGGFLFVAANSWIWELFNSGLLKVGGLSLLTFGLYYLGYYLKYEKKSAPKLGETFILIASLLIGATYFLIVQTYNLSISNDLTLLAWLFSMLPLVYIHRLKTLTVISTCIFTAWQLALTLSGAFDYVSQFLVYGLFFYSFGSCHTLFPKFSEIGLTYKNTGLFFVISNLLWLTLLYLGQLIYSPDQGQIYLNQSRELQQTVQGSLLLITSCLLAGFYFYKQCQQKQLIKIEVGVISQIILSVLILSYNLVGSLTGVSLWFTMVFGSLIFGLFHLGFKRENLVAVNLATTYLMLFLIGVFNPCLCYCYLATTYLMLFLIGVYIIFASKNMSMGASVFVVGGFLLMGIGWFIEKKRRALTKAMVEKQQTLITPPVEVPSKEEEEA